MELAYILSGAFVGFLVGLTGVGGGSLMAPILILAFGFSPAVAIGSDLWFAAITKTVGGFMHRHFGSPNWKIAGILALGSLPAAVLTLIWLHETQDGKLESDALMKLLGGALILTALLTPMKDRLQRWLRVARVQVSPRTETSQMVATVVGGALIGCLVTLTSVGAGALVAVMLMFLYPLRLNTKSIVGTDIIHAVPLALIAAIGHSLFGNVDWVLLGKLLIGSIPGIIVGSLVAGRINDGYVRVALSLMLAVSGTKLLLS